MPGKLFEAGGNGAGQACPGEGCPGKQFPGQRPRNTFCFSRRDNLGRVHHLGVRLLGLGQLRPDHLHALGGSQVVEVRPGARVREPGHGQLALDGAGGLGCGLHPGVLPGLHLCGVVIVRHQDDVALRGQPSNHGGHGLEVAAVEGNQARLPRRGMDGQARSKALRDVERPLTAHDGKMTTLHLPACQEPLPTVRHDELQGHDLAGIVEDRHHQPPVLGQPKAVHRGHALF